MEALTKGLHTAVELRENKIKSEQYMYECFMKNMMVSVFTYNILTKDNEHFVSYRKKLPTKVFDFIYNEQKQWLETNFKILKNVYTDSEGLTYNSLTKIN